MRYMYIFFVHTFDVELGLFNALRLAVRGTQRNQEDEDAECRPFSQPRHSRGHHLPSPRRLWRFAHHRASARPIRPPPINSIGGPSDRRRAGKVQGCRAAAAPGGRRSLSFHRRLGQEANMGQAGVGVEVSEQGEILTWWQLSFIFLSLSPCLSISLYYTPACHMSHCLCRLPIRADFKVSL